MDEFEFRPLRKEDIGDVIELVQESFKSEIMQYMLYGQSGIKQFVEDSLPQPGVMPTRSFWIAQHRSSGAVAGYADFDIRNQAAPHLSYICVARLFRGKGIATQLILETIARNEESKSLQLDVFSSNEVAYSVYKKLGFQESERTGWYERELPATNLLPLRLLRISNFPRSIAMFDRFGFTICDVEDQEYGSFQVGRYGKSVIKVFSNDIFENLELLRTFRTAFPGSEKAVLISDIRPAVPRAKDVTLLLESIRMSKVLPRKL